jgi:hypothetical protein
VLLNLIASATADDTKTAVAVASTDIKLLPYNGKRHISLLQCSQIYIYICLSVCHIQHYAAQLAPFGVESWY